MHVFGVNTPISLYIKKLFKNSTALIGTKPSNYNAYLL